jgi:cation:H+ antiporter
MIFFEYLSVFGGGLLLYFGAEWFVAGASALALALRVPQIMIGLTVVAYGTSAPEIIVGIQAAHAGYGGVALGNVIGSNIVNIGLILGISAMICPASVNGALRRRELPLLLGSTALVPLILLDGVVSKWESSGLLLVALVYTLWMLRTARSQLHGVASVSLGNDAQLTLPRYLRRPAYASVTAIVGLGILLLGGHWFVDGAVKVAKTLGMSERLVGLSIVAIGTSLPELMTSMIASRRGCSDLAVGNVVGSNIFNVLLCLGTAALAGAVGAPLQSMKFDLSALFLLTAYGAFLIRKHRTISRFEGAFAVLLYLTFMVFTIVSS